MLPTKAALVLLLLASIYLIARGQTVPGGADCLDFADIALVVDVSGSIEGDGDYPGKFDEQVKPFLKTFAQGLNVTAGRVQIGMVTFGNYGTLEFGLTPNINEVMRNIDLFDYKSRGKNTNTSGGIYVMRTQLLSSKDPKYRPTAAHIAVVITDGISTIEHELTIPAAMAAQKDGIIMLAVGVTTQLNLNELIGIASPLAPFNVTSLENGIKNGVFTPSGTVAYVPEIADLVDVVNRLVMHFKNTVCTATGNCPGGDKAEWCNTVSDNSCKNASVAATCCGTCGPAVKVCDDYADIVFVADVSGSIGKDRNDTAYFDRQVKPFLKNFVRRLNVGPGKIQVGMVTFGNHGYLQFTLKSNVDDILRGIDNIVYPPQGENTNTSAGIYIMRTQVLSSNSPNYRKDASHMAIIVTDGRSTWDHEKTVPYAIDAKNQGIIIFTVGATDSIDVRELVEMASSVPGFNVSVIEIAIKNNVTNFSGLVAYSPSIENLNEIVYQVSSYLARTDCAQAAVIVECKNNAYWCTSLFPGQCYDPQTERTCCQFCREHQKPNSDCRYGDQNSWCAPQYCYDKSGNCCETCPMFECRDNADWCSGIFPGRCYDFKTEMTCCKRCRQLLTGNPACRYGNEFDWCAPQYCWDKSVNCCGSCPPPTECKDIANWCPTIFPGYCYDRSTEQTCCKFCRDRLKSDLMCRYGDHPPWCQPQFCWDKNSNCCQTCPRFS